MSWYTTALLKPCGAKQGAVSLYLLLPTPVLLLCVCPLFPPTFISPVMEDCIRTKSNSVWIRTCCGCTTPLWQCWVEFCNLSRLSEDVFAAWSRFWGCFHQQPCPPFGIAPGNARANSCSPSHCYHVAFTFCLSFGWCQNSVWNVDASSHFQATSNKCFICICTAHLGWNVWWVNGVLPLSVTPATTIRVFLPLPLHKSFISSVLHYQMPLFLHQGPPLEVIAS